MSLQQRSKLLLRSFRNRVDLALLNRFYVCDVWLILNLFKPGDQTKISIPNLCNNQFLFVFT